MSEVRILLGAPVREGDRPVHGDPLFLSRSFQSVRPKPSEGLQKAHSFVHERNGQWQRERRRFGKPLEKDDASARPVCGVSFARGESPGSRERGVFPGRWKRPDEMKRREKTHSGRWNFRKLGMAVFLAVFLILYRPPIGKSIENLMRSTFHAVRDFRSFQANLATPNSGEQVLPAPVREMLALLRAHHLTAYRVSERIMTAEETLIYQRIVESAWPRRIDSRSGHEFRFVSEPPTPGCAEIERKKEISLVLCR